LVFKTTYIDRGKPLREGAFSFTRMTLFSPLDKRNTRDKATGLRITSERYIGDLGYPYDLTHGISLAQAAPLSLVRLLQKGGERTYNSGVSQAFMGLFFYKVATFGDYFH